MMIHVLYNNIIQYPYIYMAHITNWRDHHLERHRDECCASPGHRFFWSLAIDRVRDGWFEVDHRYRSELPVPIVVMHLVKLVTSSDALLFDS